MKDKITQEIIQFISKSSGIPTERITRDSNFKEDLDIDSLEMMEIVFYIEDQYNLNLTCTPSEIKTIEDLSLIISKHIDKSRSFA